MVRRDCRGTGGSHGGRARRDAPAQAEGRRAARGQVNLSAIQPTQRRPLGATRHEHYFPRRAYARSQPLRANLPRRRSHAERSRHTRRIHGRAHRDRVRAGSTDTRLKINARAKETVGANAVALLRPRDFLFQTNFRFLRDSKGRGTCPTPRPRLSTARAAGSRTAAVGG